MAFNTCNNLKSVYCYATVPPAAGDNLFSGDTYSRATLYVPTGSKADYSTASEWSNFTKTEEAELGGIDRISVSGDIQVSVNNGSIVITNSFAPAEVFSMNGTRVYLGTDRVISNITPGIYVVRICGKSVKVIL